MKWRKLGLVFSPPHGIPWMAGYAAVPVADHIDGALFRVYVTPRDSRNRSHIAAFCLDLKRLDAIRDLTQAPLLSPGEPGAFDDSGAMTAWLVNHEKKKYLYYLGWNAGVTVPFYNSIGLAISDDGGQSYRRASRGPIIARDDCDPFFTACPCVLREENVWRMWYPSCVRWEPVGSTLRHHYNVKYAESNDGLHWRKTEAVAIDFASQDEYAISRPSVLKTGGRYRMWYSYRGQAYRIGYAESTDGIHWQRKDDEAGIDVSPNGWDSEMIEYPFVFAHNDRLYMLYNGNDYGRTGVGLAVLEQD